jgi:EF hand
MQKHIRALTVSAFILAGGAISASAEGPGVGGLPPSPMMMRMMFVLMDTDGDGTVSLQEFQSAHERMFKAMDTNKDGRLTVEEMQAFMQPRTPAPRQ